MRCLRDYPFGFESGLVSFASSQAEKLGFAPTGYEYRGYKNWRGISKPCRCPFCKLAKGEIRKARGGFHGVCPNYGA